MFDKVVVITDRVILDRQLQDTIYQFEHARGVVVKIDEDSSQLAEALAGEQARIIITTLQKFPFVIDKIGDAARRAATRSSIDEAHSSQAGEAAKDLRVALGAGEEQELTVAEAEDAGLLAAAIDPVEEALASRPARAAGASRTSRSSRSPRRRRAARWRCSARSNPDDREVRAVPSLLDAAGDRGGVHHGRARQLHDLPDLLEDREGDRGGPGVRRQEGPPGDRAVRQPASAPPGAEGRDHRRALPRSTRARRCSGAAKAMVVTSSRLHAVRYKQAIDKYIAEQGYADIKTLVAFSGKVDDGTGIAADRGGDERLPRVADRRAVRAARYGVLIVAEKFQTGFDQPLLHTMYVDKALVGLAAVQTLSRLNRIHPLKERTFVLDFRNDTEDDRRGVRAVPRAARSRRRPTRTSCGTPAGGSTTSTCCAPRRSRRRCRRCSVPAASEEQRSAAAYAALGPAQGAVRGARATRSGSSSGTRSTRFVRTYSFVSQIAAFTDPSLERDYVYCRALSLYLRDTATVERLDLGDRGRADPPAPPDDLQGHACRSTPAGRGPVVLRRRARGPAGARAGAPLRASSRSSTSASAPTSTNADQLLFDQFEESWVADGELLSRRRATRSTTSASRSTASSCTLIDRMDANEEIFKRILDDPEFRQVLKDFYAKRVYRKARGSD